MHWLRGVLSLYRFSVLLRESEHMRLRAERAQNPKDVMDGDERFAVWSMGWLGDARKCFAGA